MAAIVACSASAFRADTISVATSNMPAPVNVKVIVPDGNGPFPTVYLLNGYDGNHLQWNRTQPLLGEIADNYGVVMVMPDGQDTWYWDVPEKPELKMETFITADLVPYIDSNYPTVADRAKRAITGFSMGGHGAFWLATRHPELFGAIGSASGGVDIRDFPTNWNLASLLGTKAEHPERWEEYTVINLVPQIAENGQKIIFDCGSDDFFYGVNNNLHSALLEAKVPHDYISRPGGHTHPYWANAILYHILFFSEAFNASK